MLHCQTLPAEGAMNVAAPFALVEHNANLLLAALPAEELAHMLPMLEQVHVDIGSVLTHPGDLINYI